MYFQFMNKQLKNKKFCLKLQFFFVVVSVNLLFFRESFGMMIHTESVYWDVAVFFGEV